MNKVQNKFRKEMAKAEKNQLKKARRNKGVFSNKLFLLRFYGYDGFNKEKKSILVRFFVIILGVFKFILLLIFTLIFIVLAIVFFRNYTNN